MSVLSQDRAFGMTASATLSAAGLVFTAATPGHTGSPSQGLGRAAATAGGDHPWG